jgi:hypothetical protein
MAETAAPAGLLRVTATLAYGRACVAPALWAFLARWPAVRIELSTAARKSATWRRKTRPVAGRQAPWRARLPHSWRGPWRFGP